MRRHRAICLVVSLLAACGGSNTPTGPSKTAAPTRVIKLTGDLAFGNVVIGQTASSTFTITNTGNAPLTISGMSITSGLGAVFTPSWSSGQIASGGSQQVTNQFVP